MEWPFWEITAMMSDRRLSNRRNVDIFVECRVPASGTSAIMVDISCSGCRIATRGKLHQGQTVMVKFTGWPELAGTVMWSQANLAGVQFMNRLPEQMVDKLVADFSIEKSDAA